MTDRMLRVGIIGAGQAGERHAVGFAQTATTQVVAVADLDATRVHALATRFNATAFTDWRAMVAHGLDILVVCLPYHMHVAPAEAAAARGIHLLMEKPIATTLADGQRILAVCEAAKVKLTISFVHRYREEGLLLKQWLTAGALGMPQTVRETMNGQGSDHLPRWVYSRAAAGGGVLMYSAIHAVDRVRWLLDSEVTTVTAQTHYAPDAQGDDDVERGVVALLTFANGATAALSANAPNYRAQPAHWETEIYATVVVLQGGDMTTLDPHYVNSLPEVNVNLHIFQTLMRFNDELELVPELAESYASIDELTWEFKIKEGYTFHNGEPVNAEAFAFAFAINRGQTFFVNILSTAIDENQNAPLTRVRDSYL